jgi:hypothetical protein
MRLKPSLRAFQRKLGWDMISASVARKNIRAKAFANSLFRRPRLPPWAVSIMPSERVTANRPATLWFVMYCGPLALYGGPDVLAEAALMGLTSRREGGRVPSTPPTGAGGIRGVVGYRGGACKV